MQGVRNDLGAGIQSSLALSPDFTFPWCIDFVSYIFSIVCKMNGLKQKFLGSVDLS